MKDCCEISSDISERQRSVLRAVLWINASMFVAEFGGVCILMAEILAPEVVDVLVERHRRF